ncbi:hypothetical protein DLM78_07790 [Leptospira stimsonii]|uniref:Uncharacterized protein n=1 Tax=Leptospira stimsonii TaxID=2202203 RepID=A0A8B3CU65_9LEPT|nr:hypothetical protein DLM78_07790 [Leptospira stimsonii]
MRPPGIELKKEISFSEDSFLGRPEKFGSIRILFHSDSFQTFTVTYLEHFESVNYKEERSILCQMIDIVCGKERILFHKQSNNFLIIWSWFQTRRFLHF